MRWLESNKDIAAVVEKEMANIDVVFTKKLLSGEVKALRPGRKS